MEWMSRRRKQRSRSDSGQQQVSKTRAKSASKAKSGLFLKIGGGFVVLVLCILLGGYLWVRGYLRSDEFREQLGREIGAVAKGKATVGEIEWHGTAMDVAQVDLESREAGDWALRDVGAKIDLSGFWDKVWIVPQIEIRQARSEWDLTSTDSPVKKSSPSGSKKGKKSSGGQASKWLPNRTEVRELVVRDYEGEVQSLGRVLSLGME